MLLPLVARHAAQAAHETERYAAWWAAVRILREDLERSRPKPLPLYLEGVPHDQREEAYRDLIAEHLYFEWRRGRGPLLESYGLSRVPVDLVEDEFLARYQFPYGDAPALEEYERRFPDAVPVLRGRELAGGRYVRLCRLGAGATGEVWEAYDRAERTRVAIKTLRPEASEPVVLSDLRHPGIAPVLQIVRGDDGARYSVMPLATGRTLAERIREPDRNLRRLLEWFVLACDAVAYAHARGVIHGDLKPGNIMITDPGTVVVVDWGGKVLGTPGYMAPEQAEGTVTVLSDIWGLGATLREIVTGRPPEEGGRAGPLEHVCARAMAPDPRERYPAVADLADAVRRYLRRRRPFWRRLFQPEW